LGLVELVLGEARAAARLSRVAFDDELAVVLGERGEEVEDQPADRGGGVDALLEGDEVHALLARPST
jgi:hypothetical protein